ncbi:F-box/kelch-repeat protein At3g23880-like [Coffea eugenioides]|uniref:F-box/kelch-repeat protein At3g23880-like n=1 Tax=Coffea eugenioides TaxID=49369 RepID=UPI000F606DA8|nr:F-box/kelch-repeat protein At3g23880-like [Coffea eugenioides]
MSDYIPQEVMTQILIRVPVKSLLRLRCVSKSWNSLISSAYFISLYNHHAFLTKPSTPDDKLLVRHYSKDQKTEVYTVHYDNEAFAVENGIKIGFPFRGLSRYYFRIVGFSNGLLCLSDDLFGYTNLIMFWNPLIRRKFTLPSPQAVFDKLGPFMFVLGFGFDVKNNDFKVVRIAYVQGSNGYNLPPKVEIFALSVGNWREIDVDVPENWVVEYFWTQAFVRGKVHWTAYRMNMERENGKENLIMLFDLSTEVFEELLLPDALVDESPVDLCTLACKDSVAVLHYDRRVWSGSCSIWLMQEYGNFKSWSNMYNVVCEGGLGIVLSFGKDGDILLSERNGALVSHDPRTQKSKHLEIWGTKDSSFVDTYSESLSLLIEGAKILPGLPSVSESDSSGEDNEREDEGVEKHELWIQSIMIQYLTALLNH